MLVVTDKTGLFTLYTGQIIIIIIIRIVMFYSMYRALRF